jgi:hypothetical protein
MIDVQLFAIAKLIAFTLAILPQLIFNLRTGNVANRYNFLIGAAGMAFIAIERLAGASLTPISTTVFWLCVGTAGLLALFLVAKVPAGVCKTLLALLPWFLFPAYLSVVGLGFLMLFVFGSLLVRRGHSGHLPVMPAFALAGVLIFLWNVRELALT